MTKDEARKVIVSSMLEVMRDCTDPTFRAAAYEVLVSVLPSELKPSCWSTSGWDRRHFMPGQWETQ